MERLHGRNDWFEGHPDVLLAYTIGNHYKFWVQYEKEKDMRESIEKYLASLRRK